MINKKTVHSKIATKLAKLKEIKVKKVKVKKIKAEKNNDWKNLVETLIAAIVCAAIVRSLFFEPFHIPSSSMKPGLLIGDYIFVSKYSYGYSRFSFPFSLPIFSGRIFDSEPQRGDVVVFRFPPNPSINYIKRLVGLPGDQIQMQNGQLFINSKPISKEYLDGFLDSDDVEIKEYIEILPEGKMVNVLDAGDTPQDDTGIYTVPQGHYFMMGDNRDNSQDSRFASQVGYVPKENLIGKARMIFFSTKGPVWQIWTWGSAIRFNRIFKTIE